MFKRLVYSSSALKRSLAAPWSTGRFAALDSQTFPRLELFQTFAQPNRSLAEW